MALPQSATAAPIAPYCPRTAASELLAASGGIDSRSAIFTRPEVVDFILDLAGYTEDQPLHHKPPQRWHCWNKPVETAPHRATQSHNVLMGVLMGTKTKRPKMRIFSRLLAERVKYIRPTH